MQIENISKQVLYRPVNPVVIPPYANILIEESDAAEWWAEEIRRVKYGWTAPDGVWLNPVLYFHLNWMRFSVIDQKGKKSEAEQPYYFYQDKVTLDTIWFARRNKLFPQSTAKDIIATKARGVHWSYLMCSYLMWSYLIDQVNCSYLGPDTVTITRFRDEVFRPALANMHPAWMPPAYVKKRSEKSEDGKDPLTMLINADKAKYLDFTDRGVEFERHAVTFKEASKPVNINAMRGARDHVIVIDEAGKYTKNYLSMLVSTCEHVVALNMLRHGHMIIGGTSDKVSNSSSDYERLYKENTPHRKRFFIKATSLYLGEWDMHTGKCNEERALDKILARRAELQAEGDMVKLQYAIQEMPLNDWECFQMPTLSGYNASYLDARMYDIRIDGRDKKWKRGKLEYNRYASGDTNTEVHFKEDPSGDWLIHEDGMPQTDYIGLDYAAIDDYYKDESQDAEPSKGAMVIWRGEHFNVDFNDAPVAYYLGRPSTKTKLFNEFIKGMRFYGGKDGIEVLAENNDESFIKDLRKKGLFSCVRHINGKPGIRQSDKTISEQTGLCEDYIESESFAKMDSPEIIDALRQWRKKNTDLGSAFHTLLVLRDLKSQEYTRRRETSAISDSRVRFAFDRNIRKSTIRFGRQSLR